MPYSSWLEGVARGTLLHFLRFHSTRWNITKARKVCPAKNGISSFSREYRLFLGSWRTEKVATPRQEGDCCGYGPVLLERSWGRSDLAGLRTGRPTGSPWASPRGGGNWTGSTDTLFRSRKFFFIPYARISAASSARPAKARCKGMGSLKAYDEFLRLKIL